MLLKNDKEAVELQKLFLNGRNINTGGNVNPKLLGFPSTRHKQWARNQIINRKNGEIHADYFNTKQQKILLWGQKHVDIPKKHYKLSSTELCKVHKQGMVQ